MPPIYPPIPLSAWLSLAWTGLSGKQRSFRQDALRCTARLPLMVNGSQHIPQTGPALMVMNHYHRPGFQAYWFTLAISAVTPAEIHWTITSAWTDDGTPGAKFRATISPFLLPRLARVYAFTSMPPMPPRPHEITARAAAVRQLLGVAQQNPPPLLALAPEGRDHPAGELMPPPPGVGRLLAMLDGFGYPIVPIGVSEDQHRLILTFERPFHLTLPKDLNPTQRDEQAAEQVMKEIAALLPAELQGAYAGTP
ncbi:MAG: 1-acyl-sn-glycerol-3-phosphate acyltransferase [Anaerolineales bacterium]|nr:1-acyl-sn-glycerol-3-phosphate acyltransferase [Anaerolineales bacterium]